MAAHAAWLLALLLVAGTFAAGNVEAQAEPADAGITAQVQRALAQDSKLKSMKIRVETHGAVVMLSGFVRSVDDIAKAGKLARAVRGVSAVKNGLRVENRPSQA